MNHSPSPSGNRILAVLTALNFLNYIDRQALFALFPALQQDLGLSDSQLGLLASAFIVVYMLNAPIGGAVGDRVRRLPLVAASAALWSLATALTSLAKSYAQLLASRAAVGIGESTYAPIAASLIADSFPTERRGSRLAIFNLAIPVGSALGYVAGGVLAAAFGWRAAFWIVGSPGLLLAAACLRLAEAPRGAADVQRPSYRSLFSNRVYLFATAAGAALTFVLGALAAWMPTFLTRVHGYSMAEAGSLFGALTASTGLAGTFLGGFLGDAAERRRRGGYLRVSAAGLLASVPFAWLALQSDSTVLFWSALALAETLVFLNTGPLNAVIVNAVGGEIRAMAVGANILAIHLLGDAVSPWLVGWISDRTGIRAALGVAPPMLALSGILCVAAARPLRTRSC